MLTLLKKYSVAILCSILLTCSFSCSAIDINTALTNAYKNSVKFKLLQDEFLQQANQYQKIYTSFIPEAHVSVVSGERYHNPSNRFLSNDWFPETNNLHRLQSPNVFTPKAELTISHNLFNGGQDIIKLKTIKQKSYAAKEKFYNDEQELIYEGIETYLNYYSFLETSKLYEAKVHYFQKMLEIEKQKLALGESTSVSVANAQVQLSKALSEHIASITAVQNLEKKFYNFFGILPSNIELPRISNDLENSETALMNSALNNSFVLNYYKNQILEQQLKVKFCRAAVLPKINAQFSVISPLPFQPEHSTATFVVEMRIPIFNHNTAFLDSRTEIRALNMLISQYKDKLEQIKMSVASEWKQYNSIKQQIEYSDDYVKFATIALSATQHEYELGNIRITDLLKAQNNFYDSKIENIKVNVALLKHMYKIKQLTNKLTAKSLNLNVKYFIPEQKQKFKKIL